MATLALTKLIDRKLIRIVGPDCYSYLQGLLCNDLRHLYEPDRIPKRKHAKNSILCMSAFMLNPQGRAICDMILYRTPLTLSSCKFSPPGEAEDQDELLIECDAKLASGLANTLYAYRVRRKIKLTIEENLHVWSLFPRPDKQKQETSLALESSEKSLGTLLRIEEFVRNDLTVVCDPRLSAMGVRIVGYITKFDELKLKIDSIGNIGDIFDSSHKDYKLHRLKLGVGEGAKDHPESDCLPLECNADLLGSVSFNKGCYLGQELTARIHHTGVVRKRLMPITLDLSTSIKEDSGLVPIIDGSDIIDESSNKRVGVLRRVVGNRGLALLRYEQALDSKKLIHESTKTTVSTYKPFWWDNQQEDSNMPNT